MRRPVIQRSRGLTFLKTPKMYESLRELMMQAFPGSDPDGIIRTMRDMTQSYMMKKGKIISILSHKRGNRNNPHMIYNVATHSGCRQKGYMTSLLSDVFQTHPRTVFHLEVLRRNPAALSLYKKLGFEIVDGYLTRYMMKRSISR